MRLFVPIRLVLIGLGLFVISWLNLPFSGGYLFPSGVIFSLGGVWLFFSRADLSNFHSSSHSRGEILIALLWSIVLLLAILGLIFTTYFGRHRAYFFWYRFLIREGGFWETFQVITWLGTAALCAVGMVCYRRLLTRKYSLLVPALFCVFCVFVAGEESDWGQQWFHYRTPSWVQGLNATKQFNLHYIKIGSVSFAWINSYLQKLFVINYVGILPVLYFLFADVRFLVERFHVPVPHLFWMPCMLILGLVRYRWFYSRFFVPPWSWSHSEFMETIVSLMALGSVILLLNRWRRIS